MMPFNELKGVEAVVSRIEEASGLFIKPTREVTCKSHDAPEKGTSSMILRNFC
jgi:hypothetical protein